MFRTTSATYKTICTDCIRYCDQSGTYEDLVGCSMCIEADVLCGLCVRTGFAWCATCRNRVCDGCVVSFGADSATLCRLCAERCDFCLDYKATVTQCCCARTTCGEKECMDAVGFTTGLRVDRKDEITKSGQCIRFAPCRLCVLKYSAIRR